MQGYFLQLMLAGYIAAFAYSQVTTIRVSSNLVLTPVRVTDADGKAVRDLKPEDFDIKENGVRVVAARLGDPGEAPLELAMLFDTSGSVFTRFELERSAAARFLKRIMRPIDSVFIISVANQPKILLERTSSLDAALQTVARIEPTTEATAFYSSVAKAVRMFEATERQDARRVIIAISDGEDNRSLDTTQEDLLRDLQLTNCLFYSINPSGQTYDRNFISRRAQQGMESLAQQTGGFALVADGLGELAGFLDRIADELQGQYLLGYYSPATTSAGIYRTIVIQVNGRPDLQIKARPGYYPK
ncbi:MAG TPA: VWA domain-containing protein [Acidobacteriota bacterium]|nr:VWA domain-containing protein [Acidobacteriota bacterium]